MMKYYHCGVCGARFDTEAEILAHIAEKDDDSDTHDGESWSCSDDAIAILARRSKDAPWSFYGTWCFTGETDFKADESIGWEIRQLFRMGYVDVRVKRVAVARYLYDNPGAWDAP